YTTPQQLGTVVHDVFFDSGAARLHGWWMPAAGAPRATVVHAHGNAANVSNHAPLVAWLPAAGLNVLSFDYRGFGRSSGSPTLEGVVDDTLAAIAEARARSAPDAPLILLGQSLGGATAIRAAAQDAAGALRLLIVDSAFASYRGIARDAAGGGPLALVAPLALPALPDAPRDPQTLIAHVRAPVLLLHGERDGVIPIQHGERLHAAAREPKQFIRIAGGQHLDALSRSDVRQRILASIAAVL
ncbi:MAG TPA: alpha/beta fold hydrolase, partial [Albitalea sp.]|nr:alpha/beta fold hydrolase [Albitalea sp.]